MVFFLYLFSLSMLLLLSVLSGDWNYLGFEKIVFLTFLFILVYAAMVVGEVLHKDEEDDDPKNIFRR